MQTKKKFEASCLCGNIKFKIIGKLRNISNCHCKQCVKTHGNYAAYTSCYEKDITYSEKRNLKWFKSSNLAKRGFCSNCGASIFFKRKNSEKISISAGLFSNPTKLKTINNIFVKGKLDFYKINNKIPKYNKYPK
tara:strand:- start:33 stop:437 length:405 start_codon:yes stop_codon:yes gene_type:complete